MAKSTGEDVISLREVVTEYGSTDIITLSHRNFWIECDAASRK